MKLGCLFAFLSFVGLFGGGLILGLLLGLIPGVKANYEGIGSLITRLFILLVGPAAFTYGYRRQVKADKEREEKNRKRENLRPTNLRRSGPADKI